MMSLETIENPELSLYVTKIKHALERPFPVNKVKWRQGGGGNQLAYIDARDVMRRLDEVCGVGGWQCRYPFEGCCEISIKIDGEWITKSNGAGQTKIEGEKGEYSDAFKRAAVLWGVFRYGYSLKSKHKEAMPEWATPEGFDKLVKEGRI